MSTTIPQLSAQDKQYLSLLSHLRRQQPTLPVQTLEAALPHYLSQIEVHYVTQLAGTILASTAYWTPVSIQSTSTLSSIFRNAVHLKLEVLDRARNATLFTFARSVKSQMRTWLTAILKGSSTGDPALRSSIFGGLLLGLTEIDTNDLHFDPSSLQNPISTELVVTITEVLQRYQANFSQWGSEYINAAQSGANKQLELVGSLIADHLLRVPQEKWKAMDLTSLLITVTSALEMAFDEGSFIPRLYELEDQKLSLQQDSMTHLRNIIDSPLYQRVPLLSQVLAKASSLVLESRRGYSAQSSIQSACKSLNGLTSTTEEAWRRSLLSRHHKENRMGPEAEDAAAMTWTMLKTLIFSTVMVYQAILSALLYTPATKHILVPTAAMCLKSFDQLAFVVSEVGGLTSDAPFVELKKCFYTALDILSTSNEASEEFICRLCENCKTSVEEGSGLSYSRSKISYALICIEQLISQLSDDTIERNVLPVCVPNLDSTDQREIYESSHSVMLSIFGSRAGTQASAESEHTSTLAERLVPFYCEVLLKNAETGGLSLEQLKLAYTNLVRAAQQKSDLLAWLCLDSLISAIDGAREAHQSKRQLDLCVTLVSTMRAVSLHLLPKLLQSIGSILEKESEELRRDSLLEEIRKEILSGVGDTGREACLEWWDRTISAFE